MSERERVDALIRQLVDIRRRRGLTQAEVARRIRIARPAISFIETRSRRNPGIANLLAYAAAVGAEIQVVPIEEAT